MVAVTVVQRLTPNLALIGAGVTAVLVALATLAIPVVFLEDAVIASGLAAFLPAAEPPLGATARLCIGVVVGGLAAVLLWLTLSVLIGLRDARAAGTGERRPSVRRADAHPDAPPREPLRARDLAMPRVRSIVAEVEPDSIEAAAPLLPEPVIAMGRPPAEPAVSKPVLATPDRAVSPPAPRPLPFDLDQPLAAFDPAAIPDMPMAPSPPVAPLLRRKPVRQSMFDAGERFETFELTPHIRAVPASSGPTPAPISAPETDASVHALLDRLERGIARRGEREAPEAPHGLETALDALRRLAVRA